MIRLNKLAGTLHFASPITWMCIKPRLLNNSQISEYCLSPQFSTGMLVTNIWRILLKAMSFRMLMQLYTVQF